MNFNEFLKAIGEDSLLALIKEHFQTLEPMVESTHQKALSLYRDYLVLGGMPDVIKDYLHHEKDIYQTNDDLLNIIITSYLADMAKYTENTESIKNSKIYYSIPKQLGKENKKFKYSLVEKSARSREYESALEWLVASNMVLKCQGVKTPVSPLIANTEDAFKVYLSDMGILRVLANINKSEILLDKNMIYKGALTENYVAQILFAKRKELYYWQLGSQYEMDFLINMEGDIIPIEVKASDNTTSKSLNYYINRYHPNVAIRISEKNFGLENKIKSVPLYAVFCI